MSRLIVVSNRVPVPKGGQPPAGGLAVALSGAMEERGGVWFGWSGDTAPHDEGSEVRTLERGKVTYALVDLSQKDLEDYYAGFSNRMLWPLFHYRMDLTDFTRVTLGGYSGDRNACSAAEYAATSSAPMSSRAECIANCAAPTSTVGIPVRAAVIGPMVDPQGRSARCS